MDAAAFATFRAVPSSLPEQYFRAGAGIVLVSPRHPGEVLAFERSGVPGAWQFPQGGLDEDEEPERGAYRELEEETGLRASDVRLLGPFPEPLAYELPAEMRRAKTGRGQALYWFFFELVAPDSAIILPSDGEFARFRWLAFDELIAGMVAFRKPTYERLRQHLPSALGQ